MEEGPKREGFRSTGGSKNSDKGMKPELGQC